MHDQLGAVQILDLAQLVEHTTVTVPINCMVAGSIPAVEIVPSILLDTMNEK